MDAFLPILFVVAIIAVLGVLVAGIVSFAVNGEFYQKNSNILMRWRVGLQAAAIAILGLIVLFQIGR
ncbi:MAG: twin transmembrane helix small protein [Rhodospirillales bacterium]|nr:twin transmembrane helix small protein [Rhodospirillales bacterium]